MFREDFFERKGFASKKMHTQMRAQMTAPMSFLTIDHFRDIRIHNWLQGSEKLNKRNVLFIAEPHIKMISFVLFPQASQPGMNFNISKLVYYWIIFC